MRNVVVLNRNSSPLAARLAISATVDLHGVNVTAGILETPDPRFDEKAAHRAQQVLVRVRAFSCSYRDQSVIMGAALSETGTEATPFGTEFVGEVLVTGRDVDTLAPGDRVIPVAYFPDDPAEWRSPTRSTFGLPTQNAARELIVFNADQLLRIPASMSDDVAASFTTCAQTAYAMIRKAGIGAGSKVIVTAPNSSTSLFAIVALSAMGADIRAVGTSNRHEGRLRELGVSELTIVDPRQVDLGGVSLLLAGADCVLDPYADLYIAHGLRWLAPGGVYVTCGVVDQHQRFLPGKRVAGNPMDLTDTFANAIGRNLRITASCLGMPLDLENALRDVE